MPFDLYLKSANGTVAIRNAPDSDREFAESLVDLLRQGMPADEILTIEHNRGAISVPWGELRGVWIEDV
ncbi:hypothetical protein ACWT_5853 [Actinoplanes sp. SE50]|uniref:hypothetical protein n=1 Tax=unclassified Actinoplanes TaxID=2626549 RepID=UPI00023EBDC9|nr:MULTISPECIES: hypothetical protein [unclassified Actinoplanes]AEV86871.1 hypothetical protein ACPL_5984 [Actinoplanes sp. SE50/110]ATO85268.1 hypothetical protein ACWT_5853 [Actinoplanes sp. SE50]SLM02678.1 hypothetical protein ACSP50_5960 [Actinoplanes sp. SE50/110]